MATVFAPLDQRAYSTHADLGLVPHQIRRTWLSQQTFHGILADVGFKFRPDTQILDVGCGAGTRVYDYRCDGRVAFGVDIGADFSAINNALLEQGLAQEGEPVLHQLDPTHYRLPFPDNRFSLVYSDQVLEHVDNLDEVIRETHRVLQPGGTSLHVFPPRWMAIEPHTLVPFAGGLRKMWYLKLWAMLGVRSRYQQGLSSLETAQRNAVYLNSKTYYRSRSELDEVFRCYFNDVRHVNELFVKRTPRTISRLYPLIRLLPYSSTLVGTFIQRAVCLVKQQQA